MNKKLFENIYKESLEETKFKDFALSSHISINVTKVDENEVLCEAIYDNGDVRTSSKTTLHKNRNIEEAIKSEINEVARSSAKSLLDNSYSVEMLYTIRDDLISDLDYEKLLEVITYIEEYLNKDYY